MQQLPKKTTGSAITNPIVINDASAVSVPNKVDLLLAVATATDQTNLIPNGNTKVVAFKITLTLWKSQTKSGSTNQFEYKATSTTMDVTINLATNPATQKTDLSSIITDGNLDAISFAGAIPTDAELLSAIKNKFGSAIPDNFTTREFTINAGQTSTQAIITGQDNYQVSLTLVYSKQ